MSQEPITAVGSSSATNSRSVRSCPGIQEINLKDNIIMARNEGEGFISACRNGGNYEGQTADVWYSLTMSIMEGLKARIHELPQNMQNEATNALNDFQKAMKNYMDSSGSAYYESKVDTTHNTLQQAFGVS